MGLKEKIFLFIFCLIAGTAWSTHNRAGEITYEQIGPLTIRATITTYTKASSTAADRDSLELFWGDGKSEFVLRANGNGQGEVIPGEDIKINYYIAEHTYPGRATYTLSFRDPNRVNDILNVNFPNSVDVPFYVETTFSFLNPQFQGLNSSVVLLQPPIDFACAGQPFIHNPNAFDPDGDSLSYQLIVPLQDLGVNVPGYVYPDEINPGPMNQISLDARTGDFTWRSPQNPGEYNIAIRINEYREGVLINSTVRDMQIFVDLCENRPPSIEVEEEICIIAGETLRLPVTVTDPDSFQLVKLSATGGPFQVAIQPATYLGPGGYQESPLKAELVWETRCIHISDHAYQIVFRAVDNYISETNGLATLKTVRIRVVGPPPEDVRGQGQNNSIRIDWALPYDCEDAEDDYFLGFSVWRRSGSNPFEVDSCENGLAGKGYTRIEYITTENNGNRYVHEDFDVLKSKIYCYRILANFARTTPSGNPYNIVESLSSMEVCFQLDQDLPLITHVTVDDTDMNDGKMTVRWIKPVAEDLDTIENPGPYIYQLKRSQDGGNTFAEIPSARFTSEFLGSAVPLEFRDTGLNTQDIQYTYAVDFYVANSTTPYGSSENASSVYLTMVSSDNSNTLQWDETVPWQNFNYTIYRQEGSGGIFDSLGTTTSRSFVDANAGNGIEYCYFLRTTGRYGLETTPDPLVNLSQIVCGTPVDSVGPCAPQLTVDNPCSFINQGVEITDFYNLLNWTRPDLTCDNSDDISGYNIYYSQINNQDLERVATLDNREQNTFEHVPDVSINGCYAVSALDSLGNESALSNIVCVENCPVYRLPNTFTPNGDGANDLFVPIENRFVIEIDFKVFNRWGNLIFETRDPQINWNGKTLSGSEADQGTYYYTCVVFEQNLEGVISQRDLLSGFIQLFK